MSNPEDQRLSEDRVFRARELEKGAERLERRAHALILEASELRKLATKLRAAQQEYVL